MDDIKALPGAEDQSLTAQATNLPKVARPETDKGSNNNG